MSRQHPTDDRHSSHALHAPSRRAEPPDRARGDSLRGEVVPERRDYFRAPFRRPAGACEILLVRHGESMRAVEGTPFPLVDGRGDPPLGPVGEKQAVLLADRLVASDGPISAIYVTTLKRTRQTAAPLAARLGIEPHVEPDLREVSFGEWEGGGSSRKSPEEIRSIWLQVVAEQRYDVIPGAEPSDAFLARVQSGIERIATRHADQTVVAVVHGGVIGAILSIATGARNVAFNRAFSAADNGSISHLVVTADRWIVRRFNDTAHLGFGYTVAPGPLT